MNRRSLRHITRQRLEKNDIRTVAAELRAMEDRPAAIVAATLVEDALEDRIIQRMKKLTKTERDYLFMGNGPLATFAAKIHVSHAFKLIYPTVARQLEIVKEALSGQIEQLSNKRGAGNIMRQAGAIQRARLIGSL